MTIKVIVRYFESHGFCRGSSPADSHVLSWVRRDEHEEAPLRFLPERKAGTKIFDTIHIAAFAGFDIILAIKIRTEPDVLYFKVPLSGIGCKPIKAYRAINRIREALLTIGSKKMVEQHELKLDESCCSASLDTNDLDLTFLEFKLLSVLYKNPGRVYDRQTLMDLIYPDYRVVSERAIDSLIKKIRKRFRSITRDAMFIHTVYGKGYKFEVGIRPETSLTRFHPET